MCEVDQETTPSSPRAGCHHQAVGPCPPLTPLLDAEVACGGEGSWEEVYGVRMDTSDTLFPEQTEVNTSVKRNLRHRPLEPGSECALPCTQLQAGPHSCHPWNRAFCAISSSSPPPFLSLPAGGSAGSALGSCGPGNSPVHGRFDLQHTWKSVPHAHPAVIIWVPHTLWTSPARGRGAGAPQGGDWSLITTRVPLPLQLHASGSPHPATKSQCTASVPQMLPGGDETMNSACLHCATPLVLSLSP